MNDSFRKSLFRFFLGLWGISLSFSPQIIYAAEELVIEMTGDAAPSHKEQTLWNKNALQLTQQFRSKNKNDILETIDAIPAQDILLTDSAGKEYQLVQYGQDTRDYRKFIFTNIPPYPFVTCAASPSDIITVYQRYGINLGMRKGDFLAAYPTVNNPEIFTATSESLTIYRLPAEQLPLTGKQPLFLVFNQNKLVKFLEGEPALEEYKKKIKPATVPQQKHPPVAPKSSNPPNRKPYKALVSGGTLHDRMYMPRVIKGSFTPSPNPKSATAN